MENYKQTIKRRRLFDIAGMAAVIIIYIALNFFLPESMKAADNLSSFISGFQAGLGMVFIVFSIMDIAKINKALKDEEKLSEMHIEDTDERAQKIQKEVESTTSSVFMVVLLLCTIVAGYFNSVVFFTLLASLVVFAAIRGMCKAYFSKKF